MAQYIDKTAVVTEIIKIYDRNRSNGYIDICNEMDYILSFLDSLEVKEVDLKKEINKYIRDNICGYTVPGVEETAKYFFELGLKIQKGGEE